MSQTCFKYNIQTPDENFLSQTVSGTPSVIIEHLAQTVMKYEEMFGSVTIQLAEALYNGKPVSKKKLESLNTLVALTTEQKKLDALRIVNEVSHGAVAAKVRASKEKNPEHYCKTPGCLWRTTNNPCKKHPVKEPATVAENLQTILSNPKKTKMLKKALSQNSTTGRQNSVAIKPKSTIKKSRNTIKKTRNTIKNASPLAVSTSPYRDQSNVSNLKQNLKTVLRDAKKRKKFVKELEERCWKGSIKEEDAQADSIILPELKVGDILLVGKFKNRSAIIKSFTTDEHGQPVAQTTKGDQKIFKPRIAKIMPSKKTDDKAPEVPAQAPVPTATPVPEAQLFDKMGKKTKQAVNEDESHYLPAHPKGHKIYYGSEKGAKHMAGKLEPHYPGKVKVGGHANKSVYVDTHHPASHVQAKSKENGGGGNEVQPADRKPRPGHELCSVCHKAPETHKKIEHMTKGGDTLFGTRGDHPFSSAE